MNTNFLDALKASVTAKQLEQASQSNAKPEIKAGLQAKALNDLMSLPVTKDLDQKFRNAGIAITDPTPKLNVTIELNVNQKRIDIYFSEPISRNVLEILRDEEWLMGKNSNNWYNKDNDHNRLFCNAYFNASFEDPKEDQPYIDPSLELASNSEQGFNESMNEMGAITFERYKIQVNELVAYFKCEASDLPLMAVNFFHKHTFSKDS